MIKSRMLAAVALAMSLASLPAVGHSDVLIDDNVQVSPAKVRPLEFDVGPGGTRVLCTYHVEEGRSGVRAVLLKRSEVRQWLSGRAHRILAATPYADSGGFSSLVDEPGAYSIVLDNRLEGRDTAVVRLQVKLVSGAGKAVRAQTAVLCRAEITVWTSVALFGLLALLAGWRIYLALEQRRRRSTIQHWTDPLY